jgi:NAD(P)-dependent dehydrogenase (short-subunit alcohol dehydrogenase family)
MCDKISPNAALILFSRSLGGDSVRHGVRVMAVNPGPVETAQRRCRSLRT